jgi:hypothetical protein
LILLALKIPVSAVRFRPWPPLNQQLTFKKSLVKISLREFCVSPSALSCALTQLRGFALDFAESKKLLPYESVPGLWITTEKGL